MHYQGNRQVPALPSRAVSLCLRFPACLPRNVATPPGITRATLQATVCGDAPARVGAPGNVTRAVHGESE